MCLILPLARGFPLNSRLVPSPHTHTHIRRASPVTLSSTPSASTSESAVYSDATGPGPRLLYCNDLSKSYDGTRYQFRDISFGVAEGARIGLIGVNGVGKSTLMKCLAGIETPDSGSVGVEGRPVVLYVEQEPAQGPGTAASEWTVTDALTEPMVAGPSAATPAAAKVQASLAAVRAYWQANAASDAREGQPWGAEDEAAEEMMNKAMDQMGGWLCVLYVCVLSVGMGGWMVGRGE